MRPSVRRVWTPTLVPPTLMLMLTLMLILLMLLMRMRMLPLLLIAVPAAARMANRGRCASLPRYTTCPQTANTSGLSAAPPEGAADGDRGRLVFREPLVFGIFRVGSAAPLFVESGCAG